MARTRVQAMVFRGSRALFAYGSAGGGWLRHSFIGGGVEPGESDEAALLRELSEEACVAGTIVFRVPEPGRSDHVTFLVDIGDQEPRLGSDPEESDRPPAERQLQQIIWLDLDAPDAFTPIDRRYFALLLDECRRRGYEREWFGPLRRLMADEAAVRREEGQ